MKTGYRWMVLCFLLLTPIAVFASGSADRDLQSVSVDLDLMDITEEVLFGDRDLMVFVLLVRGHAEIPGVGQVLYSSFVATEPSAPHEECREGEVGGIGTGTSTLSFPGSGILVLDIASMEQCVNPATGEFRVTQKETVTGGTGRMAEAKGEILLEVTGQIGSGQSIRITGELNLPEI